MDNQDLGRGNLDPKEGFGRKLWRIISNQRGGIGDPPAGDPPAGDPPAGDPPTLIDPATIDFSKIDWEKPSNWKGEFAADPAMEKHKSPVSLIKQVKELEQFVGMDKIPLPTPPKEGATPEEIEKYNNQMGFVYGKLGRPESADKYDIKAEFPTEAPLSDEAMGIIKNAAFKEGMSNKQLNAVVSEYGKFLQGEVKKYNDEKIQAAEAAVTAIKQKWGSGFDERVAIAQKAFVGLVNTDNLKKLFGGDKLGNDPEMLEFFYNLGTKLGEGALGGSPVALTMTPEAVKHKIEKLRIKQTSLKPGTLEERFLQKQIDELVASQKAE